MKMAIAFLCGCILMMIMDMAFGQETEYTRCVNGKGQVVIVTNWTCPAGYWPS